MWLESSEEKKNTDVSEVQELLDEIDETIEALKLEIKEEVGHIRI